MYSSGLRVSEAVHLHYDDISRTNMTIHVRETKGRTDRYTVLSQRNLGLLTEYWFQCGRPKGILFPSSWTGDYLDIASVNQFFKASAKKAALHAAYLPMPAVTALPAIYSRAEWISNISSLFLVMLIPVLQMYICM